VTFCGSRSAGYADRPAGFFRILFFAVSVLPSLAGCMSREPGADSWGVVVGSLPENISVRNITDGTVSYIFHQTHEPLFRQEDGQNFTSRVLLGWSRNIDCTEYKFCPDTSLKFDEEIAFSAEFLNSFIGGVTQKITPDFTVVLEGGCSIVRFPEGRPGYLSFLTRYDNAPSVEIKGVAYGLGFFYVSTVTNNEIELSRKIPESRGYNRVRIYAYQGEKDQNLRNRGISDFNRLSSFQQPAWIKGSYLSFDNIELRVASLAINHPDVNFRRVIYNCIDVDEFRRAIIPARKEFYDVQTLLPVGVPGAKGGLPRQTCSVPGRFAGRKIVLANERADNSEQLREYVKKFNTKTGLMMSVKQYKPGSLDAELLNSGKPRDYDIAFIVTANSSPDQEGFFAFYSGKVRVIDHIPEKILRGYGILDSEVDPEKKKAMAEELADRFRDDALALPLYQTFARLYYPPGIKNLAVGRGFAEIPDIGDLRW